MAGGMTRLLISARDPAAAWNMVEVARVALADPRFDIHVHAAEPAFGILAGQGLPVRRFHAGPANAPASPEADAVLAEAALLLDAVRPDAVLVGLSQPGEGGIDEALLALATVPRYALQDFWGDVNGFFGRTADLYFVMDEEAARLTRALHGVSALTIGSPRYARYAGIDVGALRRETRGHLGVGDGVPLIGLFGQPLWQEPGYGRTVTAFAHAAAAVSGASVLLRPHPREPTEAVVTVQRQLEGAGVCVLSATSGSSDPYLAACDAVCSAFSLSGLDVLQLSAQSPKPLGGVVYMLFDSGLCDAYRASSRLDTIPLVTHGLALAPASADDLTDALATALSPAWQQRVRARAGAVLPQSARAAAMLIDVVGKGGV